MTVTFGNAVHLTNVWLPELTPTTGKAVSTAVALLVMAGILTTVAALFTSFCLERAVPRGRLGVIFVVSALAMAVCAGGLQHITGTNVVNNAAPTATRAEALAAARAAAAPERSWRTGAREVAAAGRSVQSGWTAKDLRAISTAVATDKGMTLGYADAPAVIETTTLTDDYIARHGTSFVHSGTKLRCVVKLSDVTRNNVGQPLRVTVDTVRCVPAAPVQAKAA